ncbi:MBL fold metallo-hydrolase [Rivibacter subsaxonicus]|nr:3',5'-cyclic-nucleotide phosphodiesterase [Rivibacter subsaxonicus]
MSSALRIQVLGCSGSIAAGCRTTAFLLDEHTLIDAGTGVGDLTLEQMVAIDDILVSHSHLDHVLAIPLLADSVMRRRLQQPERGPIRVHALPATLHALRTHLFNGDLWPDFTALPSRDWPILSLHEIAVGQRLTLGRGERARTVRVLPAAHTVPAVGFAVETTTGLWVYTGDTGPNPALWTALSGQRIAHLVIETAFADEERALAEVSGHHAPGTLAAELKRLDGAVTVHITHPKPGEAEAVIAQIHAVERRHHVALLQAGQVFSL